jgi:hypothetical protein
MLGARGAANPSPASLRQTTTGGHPTDSGDTPLRVGPRNCGQSLTSASNAKINRGICASVYEEAAGTREVSRPAPSSCVQIRDFVSNPLWPCSCWQLLRAYL